MLADDDKADFFITAQRSTSPVLKNDGESPEKPPKEQESATPRSSQEKHKWDEYLLSILSRPTAQWIVTQKTDPQDNRYRVSYVLEKF